MISIHYGSWRMTAECLSLCNMVSGTGFAGAMMSGPFKGDVQATVGGPFYRHNHPAPRSRLQISRNLRAPELAESGMFLSSKRRYEIISRHLSELINLSAQ